MFWLKKQKNDAGKLFKEITQDVVMVMMSMHVIKSPQLKFFYDDKGILEGLVQQHTTNRTILALKQESDFNYMFVCGMHAFGAGIYATIFQTKAQKPVNEFGTKELMDIASAFSRVDPYELALSSMGLNANSNNKKVFDEIIMTAIKSATKHAGKDATHPDTIKQLMQVLFNAGITVVMR